MKKIIKINIILIQIFIMISIISHVYATENKTKLEVKVQASTTKYLENNQGYLTKSIVASNPATGEVTVELKLSNTNRKYEEGNNNNNSNSNGKNSEIFIIIDESGSMYDELDNGKTRRETVREASKLLAKNILENYKNVKIGIIKFADDIKMTANLTDDINLINTGIDTYTGGATNLYDALALAKKSYSKSDANKLAVILTDGSPNSASVNKDSEGNYISVDDITKQELINLNNASINIITMMTELEDESDAKEIFGTPEKPTVGKYYYIADTKIEEIIKNNIYSDIVEQIYVPNTEMNKIQIVDYLPLNITKNFEITLSKPSIGTANKNVVDGETKSITWDIETLQDSQTATLRYTLKLNDMENPKILNKTIEIDEGVVIIYTDANQQAHKAELEDSPKIQLSDVTEKPQEPNTPSTPNIPNINSDNTTIISNIPKTGKASKIFFIALAIIIAGIIALKKYDYYKGV